MVLPEGHPHIGGHLGVSGIPAMGLLHVLDRFCDGTAVAVHRAGHPVPTADLVEHGTTDADAGIGFKAGALAAVKVAGSFEQPNHTCLDQVIQQDTAWQASQ